MCAGGGEGGGTAGERQPGLQPARACATPRTGRAGRCPPRHRVRAHARVAAASRPALRQSAGALVLEELQRQREAIQRAAGTLDAVDGDLRKADKTLKSMGRWWS